MDINLYKSFLDNAGHSYLVKEQTFIYEKFDNLCTITKIVELMNDLFKTNSLDTEYVYMLSMDTKCHPTGIFEISHGTVNSSVLQPREVLIKALLSNAVNVIIIHNHPSNDSTPSDVDIKTTRRLKEAFDLIGLTFADHIIIAKDNFYSFYENQLILK